MAVLVTYLESLGAHDSNEPFLDDTRNMSIFSSAYMSNLNTYSDSLQKSESDESTFVDMQAFSIGVV
jgi:hypothetical protein